MTVNKLAVLRADSQNQIENQKFLPGEPRDARQ